MTDDQHTDRWVPVQEIPPAEDLLKDWGEAFYRCPNTGQWVYRWADDRLVICRKENDMTTPENPDVPGFWFVYGWDWNAYPIAAFADELEARRCVDNQGYGLVVFWPFGLAWDEVDR